MRIPLVLTIAGSDSGGCAGIQADLKTFAALKVHGMSVVTSVTAQNTCRVIMTCEVAAECVQAQLEAVVEDLGFDAVKTGMIPTSEMVEALAESVMRYSLQPLVVDPVMVSTAGDALIHEAAAVALRTRLIPLATVVTPNVREAEVLTGRALVSGSDYQEAAEEIRSWGPQAVVITAGDVRLPSGEAVDYYLDDNGFTRLSSPRVSTPHTHGSGCTFASAVAAFLARGCSVPDSVQQAKRYVSRAIQASLPIGRGRGPVGHFWQWWDH